MNPPKIISIITKLDCDRDFAYTKKAVQILTDLGVTVIIDQSLKYRLGSMRERVRLAYSERELAEAADLILVLGGDGTMLDICVRVCESGKPVAGINLGHLGFLTAIERNELDRLSDIVAGNFAVEERMMLDVEILSHFTSYQKRALNEVAVTSGARCKVAEITLASTPGKLLDYRADGLIVATPTGSTAYSFSAGGPVIDPTAQVLAVTPICPHSLLRGSIIFSPDTVLTITGKTKDDQTDLCVTVDGKHSITIPEGTRIHVKRSQHTAKIIRLEAGRFYDILETKLNKK